MHTAAEYSTDDKSSLIAQNPFPPLRLWLELQIEERKKKKEAAERKRWGNLNGACTLCVYIWVWVGTCLPKIASFFSGRFTSLITGSGRLAWSAAAPPPSSSAVSEINLACLGSIENSSTNSGYTAS